MSKTDLVNYIAEEVGLTKSDATKALEAMMNGVIKGLKESEKVTLTGFFTFVAKEKTESTGRNQRTGATVTIPSITAVTIKAGSKLKEALN